MDMAYAPPLSDEARMECGIDVVELLLSMIFDKEYLSIGSTLGVFGGPPGIALTMPRGPLAGEFGRPLEQKTGRRMGI
jgi:hypothetical protein